MAEDSKTEKATPKKRRDERKKGNVFLSQDAVAVATLVAAIFITFALGGFIVSQAKEYVVFCISQCADPADLGGFVRETAMQALMILAKTVLPITLVTAFCGVAATFAQTRFLVSGELLRPKFSRLSPMQGFKRLFSLKSVIDALKGILKITLLLAIVYLSVKTQVQASPKYLYTDLAAASQDLFESCKSMSINIIIAFTAVAALDILYQWWDYERKLRMSKQEIKEEYKQTEGDPQIKGKIKENQRRMAQRRMMQQVPSADVVIRNPTHYAVALRYRPETDSAPIVLAKGQDELALRIVRVAEEHHVEVVENVPLARALYAQAELDREIPPELYGAVAEVLVYIFQLTNKTL